MGRHDADFFGLDDFGMPVGLSTTWGGLIGAGLSSAVAVGSRVWGGSFGAKWGEALGAGAGVLAGVGMLFFPNHTRSAGWSAIFTSLASAGVRAVEQLISGGPTMGVEIERTVSLQGGQLGLTTMQQVPTLNGSQVGAPPQLLSGAQNGFSANVAAQQVPAGVALNGLAGRFGATLLGSN